MRFWQWLDQKLVYAKKMTLLFSTRSKRASPMR